MVDGVAGEPESYEHPAFLVVGDKIYIGLTSYYDGPDDVVLESTPIRADFVGNTKTYDKYWSTCRLTGCKCFSSP